MSSIELNTFQPDRNTILYVCNEESNYLTVRVDALKNHLNLFKDLQALPDREPLNAIRSTRFKKETLQTLIRFVEGRETTLAITPNNIIEMLEAMDYFDVPKVWEYFSTHPKQLVAVLKEMEANLNAVERKKLESIQNKVIKILSNNNCQKALEILSNWMVPSDQRDRVFHPVITRQLKTYPVDEGIRTVARFTFGKERRAFYLDRIQFDTKTLHGILRNFLKTLALGEDLKSCPKYQQFAKNLETITGYDFLKLMTLLPNKKELYPDLLYQVLNASLDKQEDAAAEFLEQVSNALGNSDEVNTLKFNLNEVLNSYSLLRAGNLSNAQAQGDRLKPIKQALEIALEHKNLIPAAMMSKKEKQIYFLQKVALRALNNFEKRMEVFPKIDKREIPISVVIVLLGFLGFVAGIVGGISMIVFINRPSIGVRVVIELLLISSGIGIFLSSVLYSAGRNPHKKYDARQFLQGIEEDLAIFIKG